MLNYKVPFCNYLNSLFKKTYINIFSLGSLWSHEACPCPNLLEVFLQAREEIYISRMLLRVERVALVNG